MRIGESPGQLAGTVNLIELMGSRSLIRVDCNGVEVRVLVQGNHGLGEGESVSLSLDLQHGFFFGPDGDSLI